MEELPHLQNVGFEIKGSLKDVWVQHQWGGQSSVDGHFTDIPVEIWVPHCFDPSLVLNPNSLLHSLQMLLCETSSLAISITQFSVTACPSFTILALILSLARPLMIVSLSTWFLASPSQPACVTSLKALVWKSSKLKVPWNSPLEFHYCN